MRSIGARLRPSSRLSIVAALLVAVTASCNDGVNNDGGAVDRAATSPTTASSTSIVTVAPAAPEAPVLDAYRRYWATVNTYGAEAAPFDPEAFRQTFQPVATGPQYETLFDLFQLHRLKGWVFRGGEGDQLRPKVTELSADSAVVEDCTDDSGGIFDTKNNTFVQPLTPGQLTRITAVLRLDGETWKVHTQGGGDERCSL